MFAGNRSTVAYSAFGNGVLDIDALTTAFDALLASYPVLNAEIVPHERGYALRQVFEPGTTPSRCIHYPPRPSHSAWS